MYNENIKTEVADQITASSPFLSNKEFLQRITAAIAAGDK